MSTASTRPQRASAGVAAVVAGAAELATAQACKPLVDALDDWRAHLRDAIASTGHTHDSLACVLRVSRQLMTNMLNRASDRVLNARQLEALRDNPATRDAWLAFLQRHAALGGAAVTEARADEHDHMARLATLIRELGDVPRVYAEKLASGGTVDGHEVEELDLQLREAGDAIAAARVSLRVRRAG